jgi:hypothetical protein
MPTAPNLLTPAHGTALMYPEPQHSTTRLTWETVAEAASYHLLVDHGGFFLAPILDQKGISDPAWELTALPDGRYYWKVAAVGKNGGETFSTFFSFSITRTPGSPPLLVLDQFEARGNVLHIVGRTTPGAAITINGQSADVTANGDFSEYVSLPGTGHQAVTIRATDSHGRATEVTRFAGAS